ncbi:MAG: type IX secretion system sortase PorU [Saprospiraceae bacterium]|nr:type IX secretion system sortase PorU [Saprospiraceae bacterium]
MRNFILSLFLLVFIGPLVANPFSLNISLQWDDKPITIKIGGTSYQTWQFKGAAISDESPTLPWVIRDLPVNSYGDLAVEIVNARYEPFDWQATLDDKLLGESLNFVTNIEKQRNAYNAKISFVPIIRRGSSYERLVEAELRIMLVPKPDIRPRGPQNTTVSVLKDGDLYKFAVTETGMFKLTYDFLKNKLGISNLDNIDPRTIKLYGNGGGIVPTFIGEERMDDLEENHILIVGESDGKFDAADYILFYGETADKWVYDSVNQEFNLQKNIYDTKNYYFIKISAGNGQRIQNQESLNSTAYTSTTFNDFARLEQEKVNLLYDWGVRTSKSQGSGQKFYGDWFRTAREYTYENLFSFSNIVTTVPAKIKAEMALRATRSSSFSLELNDQSFTSNFASAVFVLSGEGDNEINYANTARLSATASLSNASINAKIRYPYPSGGEDGSEGWLDFIQLNVRRRLLMAGSQMVFRDVETLQYPSASFQIENANNNLLVWDISNILKPKNQEFNLNNTTLSFGAGTNTLKTFVAFDKNANFPIPEAIGKIPNQNLHSLDNIDMLIVYHPDFESEAQRLADHRANHSGLSVALARIDQVYNEFSSGRQDPTAVRDLAKMLYERSSRFKHLLLFGDGSFDPKNIHNNGGNFLPVYQSESFNPIFAFPSDDYYAILNNTQPGNPLAGELSIGIGRLPVKTIEEAQSVVSKIIKYDTTPDALSDWRNRMVFVADDEDSNRHLLDANEIADKVRENFRFLNVDKIYLDAFPQVAASGGDRFPEAKAELNRSVFKGVLAVTYLGHGGEKGWAQERVLEISDIVSWENSNQLPLFITATCSFAGYDNPTFTTAGEETILNARGGAIALMTTVRAVYADQNAALTEATLDQVFKRENGRYMLLGEVMRRAKNSFTGSSIVTNSRKYSLLGDPSMRLAIPEYNVQTTRINGQDISTAISDTLRALQKVTVEGIVTDLNGQQLNDFNGIIYPSVFDKKANVATLAQDAGSNPTSFTVQRNVIFKGRASVTNGAFKFTFVVPRDINYQFGEGKISYYGANESAMTDAAGSYEKIIIGGTSAGLSDEQGPQIEVFMNTKDFVFGGITNASPNLLVALQDENGINVVGNSIGHDLEAVLDGDTQNSFLLNDFYESDLDDYKRGSVRYPLFDLAEGRHEIRVTAWDVANNAAQGYTEFFVASSGEIALEHVLNYPNPFTDRTCFQFDHNMAGQELDVIVQIFTISGRLVKTLEKNILSDGALRLNDCIEWDGRDDYGDRLARGVYLYKVKVSANAGGASSIKGESDFEKLVILK